MIMWPKGEAKICKTFHPGSSPGMVLRSGLVGELESPLACQAGERQFESGRDRHNDLRFRSACLRQILDFSVEVTLVNRKSKI